MVRPELADLVVSYLIVECSYLLIIRESKIWLIHIVHTVQPVTHNSLLFPSSLLFVMLLLLFIILDDDWF